VKTSLGHALELVASNDNMRKGEFVVIVDGAAPDKKEHIISAEQRKLLQVLLRECSIKTAVAMAVEITGVRKKLLYQAALAMDKEKDA
jgi:16S rRNA (cytidine1402-2'-O)-methyltransferase